MSFVRKVMQHYSFLKPIEAKLASSPTADLNALRRELWQKRIEYWVRKAESFPTLKANAKTEAIEVYNLLKNPGQITYKQIGTGLVWGVQIFGCFCIGEMFGRKSIFGYKVGEWPGNTAHAHAH